MENLTHELLLALAARQQAMVEQLHSLCQINSGTSNLQGLELTYQQLANAFKTVSPIQERIRFQAFDTITMQGDVIQQQCGDALFIRKRPELKNRILLAGHMDTVYPATSAFQEVTYLNDNCLNGPGVTDMKSGLLIILNALETFEMHPSATKIGWDILINADEEIGSPVSGEFFSKIASNYKVGLLYEPAMNAEGALAKNRRGSGKFTLIATGKSSHVGRAFSEGRNAIAYLAEAIVAIHALNNKREGVTVNVGKIAGGEALNMVPDKAIAKLDVRVTEEADQQWVLNELENLITRLERPDYHLSLDGEFGRPVKKVDHATEQLFHHVQDVGRRLHLNLTWHDSGGCCDGNNLAQRGLPVIDSLGARGGAIHSPREFIYLDSLVERAALSTLLLIDLAEQLELQ